MRLDRGGELDRGHRGCGHALCAWPWRAWPRRRAGAGPSRRCRSARRARRPWWLTVQVSGADYAAVGRAIGLHKDTVATHVAEVGRHDLLPGVEAA